MNKCINKQNAIDAVHKEFDSETVVFGAGCLIANNVENILNELPYEESERKIGKWILNEEESAKHIERIWNCSECGQDIWGYDTLWNYCPNCGAKMK